MTTHFERISFNFNSLIIYPLIESDFGFYECTIDSNEISIKKFDLVNTNTANNEFDVEISGDTVEISSRYLSKHFNSQNGIVYWRKINENFSDAFNLDNIHDKYKKVVYMLLNV